MVESYNLPLVFEPGTSWLYGTGLDWVGLFVSRLANTDLQTYCQDNIFTPLGISDITYWAKKNPELAGRVVSMSIRDPSDPNGKAQAFKGPDSHAAAQTEMGGQGLYASVPSYHKILHSLLVDDEKLLKKETTATMFQPQLTKESRAALQAIYTSRPSRGPCAIGRFPPSIKYDWGLGGVLTTEDVNQEGVTYRKAGCLNWSGMPNLFWVSLTWSSLKLMSVCRTNSVPQFIDRKAGVCGMYGGQMMPSGDAQVQDMIHLFEKTVYEQAG